MVIEHCWVTIEDGGEGEEGVEDTDAEEIHARSEVRDTFFFRRVIHIDRNWQDVDAAPGRADQQGQFGFVAAGQKFHFSHLAQRVKPVACLGIR